MKTEKVIETIENQTRNVRLSKLFTMASGAGILAAAEQAIGGRYDTAIAFAIAAWVANNIANNHNEGYTERTEELALAKSEDKE